MSHRIRSKILIAAAATAAAIGALPIAAQQPPSPQVTAQDLLEGMKNPGRWVMFSGDYSGQRHSPLDQITPANVSKLQPAWTFDTGASGFQVTPLVAGGIMYVTAGRDVIALEPETAKVIWRHTAPAAVSRRGVARRSAGRPG